MKNAQIQTHIQYTELVEDPNVSTMGKRLVAE